MRALIALALAGLLAACGGGGGGTGGPDRYGPATSSAPSAAPAGTATTSGSQAPGYDYGK